MNPFKTITPITSRLGWLHTADHCAAEPQKASAKRPERAAESADDRAARRALDVRASEPKKKQTLLEWADEIAQRSGVMEYLVSERGGCTCFISAPCRACCDPITEDEAADLLNQFGDHDDPHSADSDLINAIPGAIAYAAEKVGPDGVSKFFEGYIGCDAAQVGADATVCQAYKSYDAVDITPIKQASNDAAARASGDAHVGIKQLPITAAGATGDGITDDTDAFKRCAKAKPKLVEGVVYRWADGRFETMYKAEFGVVLCAEPGKLLWHQAASDIESLVSWIKTGELIPDTPQPDAEGWIAHTPGPCPVAGDVRVRVRFLTGHESLSVYAAGSKPEWFRDGIITHYRIVSAA